MVYIAVIIIVTVTLKPVSLFSNDEPIIQEYTRTINIKQGALQGIVVRSRSTRYSPLVEQYRGIPYAAPPTGDWRFMPSKHAPSWEGIKHFDSFEPVCPQNLPDTSNMAHERKVEFLRLKKYLEDQSEDCLYLNIYAPYQERTKKGEYPVMVYIHGESFEWNSGNPYDGSVLAAYGEVIVVTLNFRLGVLGFLKTGEEESEYNSNYGLVDQIAALVWIKDNIRAFGGNPNAVTLFGHGTGAACINLLMLSPWVLQENNTMLFQRAILMGGSALSDWALVEYPLEVTYQVAKALNCQIHDDFAACLRKKRLDEIMYAITGNTAYNTRLGPVVDSRIIPNEPKKSMTTYSDIFRRFELLYGVTELESIHLLGPVALKHGMLEKERDEELRKYFYSRCQMNREYCITRTLVEYEEKYGSHIGDERDKAFLVRDALLDILSDGRTVAPLVQMGLYHAIENPNSYFYVFTHKTHSKEYISGKSYIGDELPYVFGVPLGGEKYHFDDHYTEKERLLSETIMKYFTNFAYTGDPNVQRKDGYYPIDWMQFKMEWPRMDLQRQGYLQLDDPLLVSYHYRSKKMKFWNEIFPKISNNYSISPPKWPPLGIYSSTPQNFYQERPQNPFEKSDAVYPGEDSKANEGITTINILLIILSSLLLGSLLLFLFLYYKYCRIKKRPTNEIFHPNEVTGKSATKNYEETADCNLMRIINKSKSEDSYAAVEVNRPKSKFNRQMSNSTIDAHTKVRDWITQEIVNKYSPQVQRGPDKQNKLLKSTEIQLDDVITISNSPTRPVSSVSVAVSESKNLKVDRPEKVSVAVDATPSGRGPSVLQQQPAELMKFEKLKRSSTLEDFSKVSELDKISSNINFNSQMPGEAIIKIEHSHSKSEPVQDLYSSVGNKKKLQTFGEPVLKLNEDVNVTSRDDNMQQLPMTPEESLMTIKRRNFPKVLPDYPTREILANKRRSMPVASLFSENSKSLHSSIRKFPPPIPPPRSSSTLSRKTSGSTHSEPMLAEEPPSTEEPELTCNNLYVGPLIPRDKLNTQPVYESLKPIKRSEPKVIIKPSNTRQGSIDSKANNKNIPRVVVADNLPHIEGETGLKSKRSQIPTLIKNASQNKEQSSSSDSTPSDGSDTGTVVKRI